MDTSPSRTAPSVTKDKWITHIRQKLSKGYVVIVNEERQTANFFKPGRGSESCAYQPARAMIASGELVHTGKRPNGLKYELSDNPPAPPPVQPKRVIVDDDDDEDDDVGGTQDEFTDLIGEDDDIEEEEDDDLDDVEKKEEDTYPYAEDEDED